MKFWKNNNRKNIDLTVEREYDNLIEIRNVHKVFHTDAGDFTALDGVDLQIDAGEFVSVIGKSGSGKTTLINMLTGIDRPTQGEIIVGGIPIHKLSEGQMAYWRGRNMGVVFQFFQLLPSLSVFQNVMIPMDFCNLYTPAERKERAMMLLETVDIADHAHKPPSRLSGGQQQRAAIARALANDPPIIATDEPTGNLDSKTADQIFQLFEDLVSQGKTILMVTHDEDLARRASRTVIISDGEIVNEHLARALPTLTQEVMMEVTRKLKTESFAPGEAIIKQGDEGDRFYIVTKGMAQVYLSFGNNRQILVDEIGSGAYFGEMALIQGGMRQAMVSASPETPVEVVSMDKADFMSLIEMSGETRESIERVVAERERTLSEHLMDKIS